MAGKGPTQTTYGDNGTTFWKRMYPIELSGKSGQAPKNWARQRICNEAAALWFIRENTNIPVPKVLRLGENDDGSYYLQTELIPDAIPVGDIWFECPLHGVAKCSACQGTAEKNAATFLEGTFWPALNALPGSYTTAFNGIVIPPPFVTARDKRERWPEQRSTEPKFRFMHKDLGPNNLLVNKHTLKVVGVIDWEEAGYVPAECMDYWDVTRDGYYAFYNADRVNAYIQAILR